MSFLHEKYRQIEADLPPSILIELKFRLAKRGITTPEQLCEDIPIIDDVLNKLVLAYNRKRDRSRVNATKKRDALRGKELTPLREAVAVPTPMDAPVIAVADNSTVTQLLVAENADVPTSDVVESNLTTLALQSCDVAEVPKATLHTQQVAKPVMSISKSEDVKRVIPTPQKKNTVQRHKWFI
jgi:hypothetical protein